jgi:hypothetical protein
MTEKTTVTIPLAEYEKLVDDQRFLRCLCAAGVNNWDGWNYAVEAYGEEDSDE